MVVKEVYISHVQPKLKELALKIRKDIIRRRITVLARIDKMFNDYKYGAYAVAEAWSDLDEIIKPYFNYKDHELTGTEYVELIDLFVDDLKKQKLLYMEW